MADMSSPPLQKGRQVALTALRVKHEKRTADASPARVTAITIGHNIGAECEVAHTLP